MAITKEKGDLGQSLIMADLLKRGYKVLIPLGEDWRFDLVIFRDNKFEKVQCKFDGVNIDICSIPCRSCNNWTEKRYLKSEIDWLACYHKASDRCYYVPSKMLGNEGRTFISLRINEPKNKQTKKILWAKNFENL